MSHAAADAKLVAVLQKHMHEGIPHLQLFATSQPGDLPFGEDWFQNIIRELRRRRIYLVLVTRNSKDRPWIWFETGFA